MSRKLKALLERNDELERRNEQIADEFAHKIEVKICYS
jgi:hypothetical protein